MKKNTLKIHYGILDKKRAEILKELAPQARNFVLAGGTALALQINHRKSFDLDFFSEKEISSNLLVKLNKMVKVSTVLVNTPDELSIMIPDDLKISFIYYLFLRKADYVLILENGIKLMPIDSLAAQKAYTIGRRGAYRDYFDIYAILKEKYLNLDQIITSAQKIYREIFNPKLFLEQLTYFRDLTNFEIIPVDGSIGTPHPDEVKLFLEKEVRKVLRDWK